MNRVFSISIDKGESVSKDIENSLGWLDGEFFFSQFMNNLSIEIEHKEIIPIQLLLEIWRKKYI